MPSMTWILPTPPTSHPFFSPLLPLLQSPFPSFWSSFRPRSLHTCYSHFLTCISPALPIIQVQFTCQTPSLITQSMLDLPPTTSRFSVITPHSHYPFTALIIIHDEVMCQLPWRGGICLPPGMGGREDKHRVHLVSFCISST